MKTYLAGPINGCTDAEARDWRAYVAQRLIGDAYDPMVRDYRGRELEPGIAAEIVENDKADIDACDAVLVYYEKPSVGTSMEVLYAWQAGKHVVIVDVSGKPLSPWLVYHSHVVVSSLEKAIRHLNQAAEQGANMCLGDGQPKPAGTWDWYGSGDPAHNPRNRFSSFTLGIFQWLPKKSGQGTKRGKAVMRVSGYVARPQSAYREAQVWIDKLEAKTLAQAQAEGGSDV